MIKIENIVKTFHDGDKDIEILKDISLLIKTGDKVAIVGASGSGKSTFLSIISGLDRPTSGKVIIDGVDINTLSEKDLAVFRNEKVSIIFQSFELVQFFTAYENIMLPLSIRNKKDVALIDNIIEDVGLSHRKDNMPSTLSGGEQQRVAIARAIASGSEIVFADEPTGNLDAITGKKILDTLLKIVSDTKKTFIIITHDMNIANQMDFIYNMADGKLTKLTKLNTN
jgi:putative ABC transport system ATP-binding protein